MKLRRGMTLIEVLATVAILSVALPPIMYGISLATSVAGVARQRAEATNLAEAKLDELTQTINEGQTSALSGGFDQPYEQYNWQAEEANWEESYLTQLTVTVNWTTRGKNLSVSLTTLVYNGNARSGGSDN